MKNKSKRWMTRRSWVFVSLLSVACSGPGAEELPGAEGEPPPPVSGSSSCFLSVDCAAGQHCDLGECVQACNTDNPCAGGLSCSPRARCLAEGEEDRDPDPILEHRGSIQVAAPLVQITEKDRSFTIDLSSDASTPVRYRVTTQADFVSIEEKRGEFEGDTALVFTVDPEKLKAQSGGNTIKIFTDLGEQVVQLVVNTGISGKYHGALRYSVNGMHLGDARVAVEMLDRGGEVDVLFDPELSLLFPAGESGPATGFGSFSEEEGVSFTVTQRFEKEFGGARNHFGRALGRRIAMRLQKNSLGLFEGTFTEKVFGLFEHAVDLEGTITLYPRPQEPLPDFELTSDGQMPRFEAPPWAFREIFGPDSFTNCQSTMSSLGAGWNATPEALEARLEDILSKYYHLDETMENRVTSGLSYTDLLGVCESELRTAVRPDSADVECAWLPPLACGMLYAAEVPYRTVTQNGVTTELTARLPEKFNELLPAVLNPALLMGQDYAVQALDHSLTPKGLPKEREAYNKSLATLAPVARWALHPAVIDFMASLTLDEARGAAPQPGDKGTEAESFPAARALSQLFQVLATVEGERSRIAAIDLAESNGDLVRDTQERAVLGLLEAAVLLEITKGWGVTPDIISADLSGYLNPIDSGFGALLEGARAFGIPDGYVPFVWRPEDTGRGATNFEQMLALTDDMRASQAALEDAYRLNSRSYEEAEDELRREAHNIKLTYDAQIADICGSGFDVDAVQAPEDWAACGANDQGELGVQFLSVKIAEQRIASAQSRVLGLKDKIEIDQDTLARTQKIQKETMNFVSSNNKAINGLTEAGIAIDTAIKALEIASNSNLFNGGAPLAMAAASVVAGAQKSVIAVQKQQLEQAQSMRLMRQQADIAYIEGMASIKKQVIDVVQLTVEMLEDGLAKEQAVASAAGLLERAKRLYSLRQSAVAIAGKDPSHDPAFRLLRDTQALQLLDARARVQRTLYLAARALEYEVNRPMGSLASAVLNARSSLGMSQLASCLSEIHTTHRVAFGSPQRYTTEVSVREMLGIEGLRVDEVTGQELSPGEQFRLLTQKNSAFDESGAFTVTFSTNLQSDNGLWSTDVCADRITSIQVQLVGDNLGDNEAQVNFALTGAAVMRECDSDSVQVWSMAEGTSAGASVAVVQAGVNSYGEAQPNTSLFGQSVARASWRITLPSGGVAPANRDVDLSGLEDIVLKIEHQALPRRSTPLVVDTSCLMSLN